VGLAFRRQSIRQKASTIVLLTVAGTVYFFRFTSFTGVFVTSQPSNFAKRFHGASISRRPLMGDVDRILDTALLLRAQAGDSTALEELIARHDRFLRRFPAFSIPDGCNSARTWAFFVRILAPDPSFHPPNHLTNHSLRFNLDPILLFWHRPPDGELSGVAEPLAMHGTSRSREHERPAEKV
jgi:hypothetical protein